MEALPGSGRYMVFPVYVGAFKKRRIAGWRWSFFMGTDDDVAPEPALSMEDGMKLCQKHHDQFIKERRVKTGRQFKKSTLRHE